MGKARKKALVLLSGGIDSSTSLALAREAGCELYAMSFDYHQRHRIELASAHMMASAVKVKRHLVVEFDLREIGGSALTSSIAVPKQHVRRQSNRRRHKGNEKVTADIPVTYVPARNTIFLSFALAWAEVLEAGTIYIGANAVDYSGYPDCRAEYLRAFEEMANLATKVSVSGKLRFNIEAPLISMKKSEIIRKGVQLGLDYSLSWSCYDPQKVPRSKLFHSPVISRHGYMPCLRCDSCRIREKGFQEAGIPDPLLAHI